MDQQYNQAGVIELGTASIETRGLPIAAEPETMGFKLKAPLVD
jgi:hypothetical protein